MSQQEQPREQTPVYRSVKLASPSAMPPPLRSPFAVPTKQPALQYVSSVTPKVAASDSSKPWTLCHKLPTIPAGYMLERNQISLKAKPQEVANRISECLQLRSFVLSETSTKNGFRAESTKGLLFRVNFFQDDSSLKIEFQRLNGCSYAFQKTFQAIHRCIFQQETKQELEFPTCAIPIATPAQKQERLVETFGIALNMLASKRVDSQLLGLEVLEPMSTNVDIAQRLLQDHLDTILQFCKGSMEPKSKLQQQQECLLKRRALSILANALEQTSCTDASQILDTLLASLQNNHDAHQSFPIARCLVLLGKTASQSELSRAMSLLANQKQDLPFLQQEYQKLEALLSSSS